MQCEGGTNCCQPAQPLADRSTHKKTTHCNPMLFDSHLRKPNTQHTSTLSRMFNLGRQSGRKNGKIWDFSEWGGGATPFPMLHVNLSITGKLLLLGSFFYGENAYLIFVAISGMSSGSIKVTFVPRSLLGVVAPQLFRLISSSTLFEPHLFYAYCRSSLIRPRHVDNISQVKHCRIK